MGELTDTFYFIAYVKDRTAITVIDLAFCVDYERDEFDYVNMENFDNHNDAIEYARELSDKYDLKYELFDSRYDSSLNEYLNLEL